jgi:phospholipid/cholesterol/gamma-HCH transport system ATP-binding protein
MLFRRELVMFGPREVLLTSEEPVVKQFLNGSRIGPIGMSEEKDEATMAAEQAQVEAGHHDGGTDDVRGVVPQIEPTPGLGERSAVRRRKDRVMRIIHTLPQAARDGIIASLTDEEKARYGVGAGVGAFRPSPRPRDGGWQNTSGDLNDGHPGVADLPTSNWRANPPGGGA